MTLDAWILLFLIFDVMGGVILWGHQEERRAEKKHCPLCQGMTVSEAFRTSGYLYWCRDHQEKAWSEFIGGKK